MHSNVNRGPANGVGRDMEAIFGPLSAESRRAPRQLLAIDLKQRPRSAARWLVPAASFTLIMTILGIGIASKSLCYPVGQKKSLRLKLNLIRQHCEPKPLLPPLR